ARTRRSRPASSSSSSRSRSPCPASGSSFGRASAAYGVLHFTNRMHNVSVVVVTFNSAQWIERCLESVRGYETIVVDHGSSDGTLELVRQRFPEARVIEEENVGMGGGNNAGMRLASGRYFLLLNSDAWVTGDAVEQLARFADS